MLAASSEAIPVETVKALIDQGVDVNAKSADGQTVLDFAKRLGDTSVVSHRPAVAGAAIDSIGPEC